MNHVFCKIFHPFSLVSVFLVINWRDLKTSVGNGTGGIIFIISE